MEFQIGSAHLGGELAIPPGAKGLVIFAHGSGSSRHSPRNQFVARTIREHGLATFLFDLLSSDEEVEDMLTRRLRFDIPFLAQRLIDATRWVYTQREVTPLNLGFFGSSTGAAAALVAAAELPALTSAVVSRGGRPDLAFDALPHVKAPTLFLVGEHDCSVLGLNEPAYKKLKAPRDFVIIPGATHLFEEKGTLDQVAQEAARFFTRHLQSEALRNVA